MQMRQDYFVAGDRRKLFVRFGKTALTVLPQNLSHRAVVVGFKACIHRDAAVFGLFGNKEYEALYNIVLNCIGNSMGKEKV